MLMTFGCNPQINFGHFFCSLNVVIFELITFGHWISCECNPSYSFNRIFLTLCRCFCLGLKICMTFCCNPRINFCCFFCSLNLVIFGLKSFRHWVPCERNSYSFNRIFLTLCRCFCLGLKICMTFCCNPRINFCCFFCSLNLVIFGLKSFRHWVPCERNSYSFNRIFLTLCRCFCLGLKICMTFCCNPRINFCCFFRSLNLVIFGLKSFRHWVPCERNSYSFNRIFLRLSWCLCQGLNTCMPLCCNPHINIFTFFPV